MKPAADSQSYQHADEINKKNETVKLHECLKVTKGSYMKIKQAKKKRVKAVREN